MEVYQAVVRRLGTLGYVASEDDRDEIDRLTWRCRARLLADLHQRSLPEGLEFTLVDMVAGSLLFDRLAAGELEIEGLDFSASSSLIRSISEGDVSVTYGSGAEGAETAEQRFIRRLEELMRPSERELGAYRRLAW